MLGGRHENAFLQSDFYREKYYKILRWIVILNLIMYLLVGVIVYLILFKPATKYYASTTDGQILNMPEAKSG